MQNEIHEESRELILKVKIDSYKDLQNYLNNELKITKKDIEDMLDRLIERILENKISEPDFLFKHVDLAVQNAIRKLTDYKSWNLEKDVNRAIEKAISEKVMDIVRDQLKDTKLIVK